MQKNNSQHRGNEFWDVVQNAINSGNYQELNKQVKNTIDDTAEGIRNITDGFLDGLFSNNGQKHSNSSKGNVKTRKYTQSSWNKDYQKKVQSPLPVLYVKNPSGKASGLTLMITGFSLAGVALMMGVFSLVICLAYESVFWGAATGLSSVFLAGSTALGISGVKKWNFAQRFLKYVKIIGSRSYCNIEEFVQRTGRKREIVIKDLKKMIQKKLFLQGHLDQKETCVIVTDEMYQQYLLVEKQAEERLALQQNEQAKLEKLPEECRKILEEGKEYILFIRDCNDKLPGEVISTKLDRLELIITRIFNEVEKNPALAGDLRRFMNYYLPTTRKLIQAYYDLEQEPISSENMKKTKQEIEDTLDTINQAFENLLDSFFDDKALDISSDISALHTMLAQEGLTKKDFDL